MMSLVLAAVITVALLAVQTRLFHSRRAALLLAALLLVVSVCAAALWPRTQANMRPGPALMYRAEMARAAARMMREQPVWGVGIGEFAPRSPAYRQPDAETGLPPGPENAHNNFLQIGAELGLAGLLAMLALLGMVGMVLLARLRRGDQIPATAAAIAGLLAFVLTWFSGHPLLVPLVAYPFWIALGTAAAGDPAARRITMLMRLVFLAAIVGIALSVPFRIGAKIRSTDLEHIAVNFSGWMVDSSGHEYRRAADCSGVYVPARAHAIVVPVRPDDNARLPVTVQLAVEGRAIGAFRLDARDWADVRVRLPGPTRPAGSTLVSLRVQSPRPGPGCQSTNLNVGKVVPLDIRGLRLQ
jgi:hypothetical protein